MTCLLVAAIPACAIRSARPVPAPSLPVEMRAAFRGRLHFDGESRRFRGAFALSAPDRIRVEIHGPVGGTRALLVTSANEMLVLLPESRRFIREPATPATFDALLGIPVDTGGLLELIRSADPLYCGRAVEVPGLVIECRDEGLRATLDGGALELRLKDSTPPDESGLSSSLFQLEIPDGWKRMRLDGTTRPVLLQ